MRLGQLRVDGETPVSATVGGDESNAVAAHPPQLSSVRRMGHNRFEGLIVNGRVVTELNGKADF